MDPIRLIRPYISLEELQEDLAGIFDSGVFTRGQHVRAFQEELGAYTGAPHAFAVSSATTALWTSMRMLGIGPGDEVVVSDFSWPATANVVEDVGATPVFADVSLETFNMTVESLDQKVGPATKAVIFVDALGNPDGLTEIQDYCRDRGITLVEDAACALGSYVDGVPVGGIADVTCLSFHPRKLINTGEGGAILTANPKYAKWLEVKLAAGVSGMRGIGAEFVDFGYNFRLPEIAAAMGRRQLRALDRIVEERIQTRDDYVACLHGSGFHVQAARTGVRHNIQSLAFRVPNGVDRDEMVRGMRERGIETTLGTYSMSDTAYYRSRYADVQTVGSELCRTTITVPCYRGVDVERVAQALRDCAR